MLLGFLPVSKRTARLESVPSGPCLTNGPFSVPFSPNFFCSNSAEWSVVELASQPVQARHSLPCRCVLPAFKLRMSRAAARTVSSTVATATEEGSSDGAVSPTCGALSLRQCTTTALTVSWQSCHFPLYVNRVARASTDRFSSHSVTYNSRKEHCGALCWQERVFQAPRACALKVLGSGDHRVVLLLETHLSGRKVDRRVLATDIDAELRLMTCVWDRIDQMARRSTPERSCTRV